MSAVEQLVMNHLDLWTSVIRRKSSAGRGSSKKFELYGIRKLRELILELAVRGLLVPQDPSDEPASELLRKIAKEKSRLVKEGRIKKGRTLPPISDEEKPFELPMGWEWSRLGTIGNIFNGNSVNATVKENKYTNVNGLPFIATKDVGYGFETLDYHNGVCIPAEESGFKVAKKNAVLICAEGGSAGKKCGITDRDICFGNKLFANEPLGDINSKFILSAYLTPTFFTQFSSAMTGIIGGISSAKFAELVVPIAPALEQNRIAAKVDEMIALCDQLELKIDSSLSAHQTLVKMLMNTLSSALDHAHFSKIWQHITTNFDTLFTTEDSIIQLQETILFMAVNGLIVELPENSKKGPLKNFLSFGPKNGFSPNESQIETGQKVLKLGATSYGVLDLSQTKFFEDEISKESHLWLKAGDILLQRGNSHAFVGSSILIETSIDNVIYPDLMMKLRVAAGVSPEYVSIWLCSPQARKHMWERMTGTSGTMPKISKNIVETIPIVVPPIDVQEQTVSEVKKLMTLCEQLKACLSDAQTTQLHLADAITEQALKRLP
jgi:type I restriction enzyme S subunit